MKGTVYTVSQSYAYDNILNYFCTTKNSRTYARAVICRTVVTPPSLIRF